MGFNMINMRIEPMLNDYIMKRYNELLQAKRLHPTKIKNKLVSGDTKRHLEVIKGFIVGLADFNWQGVKIMRFYRLTTIEQQKHIILCIINYMLSFSDMIYDQLQKYYTLDNIQTLTQTIDLHIEHSLLDNTKIIEALEYFGLYSEYYQNALDNIMGCQSYDYATDEMMDDLMML